MAVGAALIACLIAGLVLRRRILGAVLGICILGAVLRSCILHASSFIGSVCALVLHIAVFCHFNFPPNSLLPS